MSSTHPHGHAHGHADALSADPSRTQTVRKRYAQKLRGRYGSINAAAREGIVERDAFRLQGDALADRSIDDLPQFPFETDDRKIEGFMSWLRRQLRQGVLGVIRTNNNRYITTAYKAGLRHAGTELRALDDAPTPSHDLEAAFNLPVHQSTLQMLYTRNYEALQGINAEVAKQVGRKLTTGFAQGWNPRKMARAITDRIDAIGKTRATVLARTEVINAHATGTLERFDRLGIDTVSGKAELRTANDSSVCEVCESLDGRAFSIEEARGVIPVHPQCRCVWLPIVN